MGIFICPYKTDKKDSISTKLVDRDDTRMADIPNDILKHMLKLLATNIGASDFVRATSRYIYFDGLCFWLTDDT